jgi:signal transduction histidine kinase
MAVRPPRSIPAPRSRAMLLATLLVCTLALATMLAYEAHDAARSHRATAERALSDYAAVAAWELVAGVNDELQNSAGNALAPLTRARATTPYELLPAPATLAAGSETVLRCPAGTLDTTRLFFRVDFRDRTLAVAGGAATPAMQKWLLDTIVSHGRASYQPDWSYALVLGGPPDESPSAIAYAVKYAEHRAPIAAYGIRTCADVVSKALLPGVIARRALLPTSLTGGTSNDSLVAISAYDASGRVLFQSGHDQVSRYTADAPLSQAGALRVRASIRPRAVELLAFGALPQSRVPILVGLLTLTAAMIAVTVLQLKREHELSRLRSDFISSVSHELRTPLSQILLFAETLNLGRVRTEQERHSATDVIVQEGRRLMHLVENILHFSRAERRMTRLGPEAIDLDEAVQAIVDDWLPLAQTADVRVRLELGGNVHAVADRSALRQMLLNLLDNAAKYGPSSQTLTVGTAALERKVRFWVDDQGEGIPARERERVWDSFHRLEKHANSSIAGSGIGLFVVRELARLHGGDAWVEDAPGGGAKFVVELRSHPERSEGPAVPGLNNSRSMAEPALRSVSDVGLGMTAKS